MFRKISEVSNKLEENVESLKEKKVLSGFDGFIDCSVKAVKYRYSKEEYSTFRTITEFSTYVATKAGRSGTIEMVDGFTKIGGNMPIMSLSLAKMNVSVTCIGAMGYPKMNSQFEEMKENGCHMISVGNPGTTIAIEFDDGKLMLSQMDLLQKVTWDSIKEHISISELKKLMDSSEVLAFVNWSEMDYATEVWEGILDEIFTDGSMVSEGNIFFDLADCSKRSAEDIRKSLSLIQQFNTYRGSVLGLNENEVCMVYKAVFPDAPLTDIASMGQRLFDYLKIDTLIVHPIDCSMGWSRKDGFCKTNNFYIQHPKISTGGGDNFNSGVILGMLMGFNLEEALILGNGVSAFFVKNGYSPDMDELIAFLKEWSIGEIKRRVNSSHLM